jgi:EmrB/QacA subfamily drug resistance transporter
MVLALGGLMVIVDTTATLVTVPAIVADFDSTLPAVQWVTSGYLLGVVAAIPLSGWMANRFGARRVYVTALGVFTLASALTGLAWDVHALVAFRVLQGLAGGLLNPVGQAIGLRAVSRAARGRMMSMLGLPLIIGPVLGPPLAGWLIDTSTWRWVFLVNVPLGLLAMALCLVLLPRQKPDRSSAGEIDALGLALVSLGAVLLVYGCTAVGETGSLSALAVVTVCAGLVLLAVFCVHSVRIVRPLVDLRLLSHSPLSAGLAVLACFGAAYFGAMSILPIYVQGVRGDDATLAGTLTIPMGLAVGVTLQIATRLVDRIAPRAIVLTGILTALVGVTTLLLTTANNASYTHIAAAAAILGVGAGATLMPAMTVAVRDLENEQTPKGTTLLALVQQLASAVGVAVVATALTLSVSQRVPAVADGRGGGLATMLELDARGRAAMESQLAEAVGGTYTIAVALMALSLLAAWRGLRPERPFPSSRRTQLASPRHAE